MVASNEDSGRDVLDLENGPAIRVRRNMMWRYCMMVDWIIEVDRMRGI